MKIVMLRVGIDTGSGGIHSPLFQDGSFEFVHIPDGCNVDERTYGSLIDGRGIPLVEYFPLSRQRAMVNQSVHVDPEFATFTYGDPTRLKAGLRHLKPGDLLVFYGGLEGWDFKSEPALYLIGYFEVLTAGRATEYGENELRSLVGSNFHIRHERILRQQKSDLVLVKGSKNSRLLKRAVLISDIGCDKLGRPIKILSSAMQKIFGDFDGKVSIQRSPPRWVNTTFVARATEFVRSLK
jgi:hypothetical protein